MTLRHTKQEVGMSKSTFASSMITKLNRAIGNDGRSFNNGTPAVAMAALAQAISEYLIDNTVVTIAYDGIITTTGDPDPVTSDTFRIVGACAPPSAADSFDAWFLQLETNIIAGFSLAAMGDNGVVFPMKPFLNTKTTITRDSLTAVHNASDDSPQQKVWEVVCQGIMDWINDGAMGVPVQSAATNPSASSAGQAIITGITIT